MVNIMQIYRLVSSMQTGLLLLVTIGIIAALGSAIIPDTFYNTYWFKLLLLLLLLNMTLCSINRLRWFKTRFIYRDQSNRGWLRQVGMLILHFGIVFILAGGTIYTYYGQSGDISILRGETADVSKVMTVKSPFSLHLDDFRIEFNPDGSPSQYYSDVTVLEDGLATIEKSISVNHPFEYRDIKAYQQGFGYLVKTKYTNNAGIEAEDLLEEGNSLEIAGTKRVVKLYSYAPNFDPDQGLNQTSMKPDNPRIIFNVYENNKLLGIGAAKFDEKVKIDNDVYIVFTGVEPYTVLKVKSDPGLPLVFSGGLMFMAGISLALYSSPDASKQTPIITKQEAQ